MKKNADVIVVGGGMMGMSTAYWLTKKHRSVLVLEKAASLATGSSGATDGYIFHNTKMPGYHTNMCFMGGEMYPELLDDLGNTCGFSEHCGSYLICDDEREYEIVETATKQMRDGGMDIYMLNGDELREREPYLSKHLRGASYAPSGGKINPFELVFSYARYVEAHGGSISYDTTVQEVIREGRKAIGVKTSQGDFYADAIVDAADSYSGMLGKAAGLYVPVRPRKGQIVVTEGCAPMLNGVLSSASFFCAKLHPELMQTFRKMTMELNHGTSIEQSDAGTFLIGATNEWADFDRRNTMEGVEWLIHEACRTIPALKKVHFIRTFSGLRPFTPDHLPILGGTSHLDGYFFITGFEGGGLSLNTVAGRMLSEIICGEELCLTNEPLAPDRLVKPLDAASEEELRENVPAGKVNP